jgi:serine/threonine protein kinase
MRHVCGFPARKARAVAWYVWCVVHAVDPIQKRLGTTLLGKWHLDAVLGEGGMAVVYAATHRNGARGAVKMLRPSADVDEISRFIREGYIANHVDHPAVVRALDDDVAEDGTAFLVMELLEGKALDELAREEGGRLPLRQVLRVMDEVLDALARAHEHGVVHRDIKPENILVTVEGRVKLLDFGIAYLPEGCGPPSPKTQSGLVMGTPSFMSPEQARARWELVGPASDIWAVGATMFTLLSGEYVHLEETLPELLAAAFTEPARSLKEVVPGMPREVVALVDRALELRIADRWASAREMHEALLETERAIHDPKRRPSRSSLVSTLAPPGTRRVPRRNVLLGALDISLGIVVLGLSARCLNAKASAAVPDMGADGAVVAAPYGTASASEPTVAVTSSAAQSAASVAPPPVTVAHRGVSLPSTTSPSSTPTSRADTGTARRTIYDSRF